MYIKAFQNGETLRKIKTSSVVILKCIPFVKWLPQMVWWYFENKIYLTSAPLLPLTGDYGSAIETLVTAISLIKQSKVSADDRCKVLISSLQDCLHGIESKSYGSGSR